MINHLRSTASLVVAAVHYCMVVLAGRLFGLPVVVRYLRNPNPRVTARILQAFGAEIGENTTFKRSIYIDNSYEDENSAGDFRFLRVGRNCYIGDEVYFDLAHTVYIGDNSVVSGRVSLLTHADCNRSRFVSSCFPRSCAPLTVGAGAWIGFGATLLPGCQVGDEAVVAAGALLRAHAPTRTLYAGVPAKLVRTLAGIPDTNSPSPTPRDRHGTGVPESMWKL
jgi:acetyltransferase-like isoleucine patch superfamily enzyme